MAGSSRSAAALAGTAVRISVRHVVAHGSMVTRAYLTDIRSGIIVDRPDDGLWLISTQSALLPDPEDLKLRAERDQQIPREHGVPKLMTITVSWGDDLSAEVKNPTVIAGGRGTAAVPLVFPVSLPAKLRAENGPPMLALGDDVALQLGDTVGVAVGSSRGDLIRWARVASDPGFDGSPAALALDVALQADNAGSPVYLLAGDDVVFCGLAEPLDATTAVLLNVSSLTGAVSGADA